MVIAFDIKNTGKLAGSTVGQVYVHQARPSVEKPDVELAGFAKLYLEPGESKTTSVTLDVGTLLTHVASMLIILAQGVLLLQRSTCVLGRRGGRL